MTTKAKQAKRPAKKVINRWWQPPHGYFAVCAVLFVVAGLSAAAFVLYRDRVLPGITVGNVSVANMDAAQLTTVVKNEAAQLTVTFQDGANTMTVPAKDLGVDVDVDTTVNQALLSRRSTDVAKNLALWQSQTVPLSYTNDAGVLKDYIATHFPKLYVDPQDAWLEFNAATGEFDLHPGVPGRGFDIKKFEAALPDLAKNPRAVTLPVMTVPVQPLIGDAAAKKVQTEINSKLKLSFEFLFNGKVAYTAMPDDIASWAHFNPDTTAGTLSLEFDKAKVEQFIADKVGAKIATRPVDRKVVVDKTTGAQTIIQAGSKGYQIDEADKLAEDVMAALGKNESLSKQVAVTEAPFKTVTMTGAGKWIEVDLSRQTVTMYIGDDVVANFLISSGKAATPTAIGEGRVYAKYPLQTMTGTINGEYYYVPNIKWVSYFYGGEAFHGTYWHHNFGHPMSHGCINMTEADAKVLYDFAPIGTKVIVHA